MSEGNPIWHSPGWITACVALVTAFLTIPEKISKYYSERVETDSKKTESQLKVIEQALETDGNNRVFWLRYLAANSDDPSASAWAAEEVSRYDAISDLNKENADLRLQIEGMREELISANVAGSAAESLKKQITDLSNKISIKDNEIRSLREKAGLLDEASDLVDGYILNITLKATSDSPLEDNISIFVSSFDLVPIGTCIFTTKVCDLMVSNKYQALLILAQNNKHLEAIEKVELVSKISADSDVVAMQVYHCGLIENSENPKMVCSTKEIIGPIRELGRPPGFGG